MTITQTDLVEKGKAVRDKAVEKWIEASAGGIEAAFSPGAVLPEVEFALSGEFDFIVDMFREISYRDPASLGAMLVDLESTRLTLASPGTELVDTVKGKISDWNGDAAQNFELNYLNDLPKVNTNQLDYVDMLKNSLNGVKVMLEKSREDTMAMGTKTIAALDALEQPSPLSLVLTVVGAVASLFYPPAGGALIAAVASTTASVGSAAAAYESQLISGEDVGAIIYSMCDTYVDLLSAMESMETEISDLLAQVMSNVQEVPSWYRPKTPAIAGYGELSKSEREDMREEFEPGY